MRISPLNKMFHSFRQGNTSLKILALIVALAVVGLVGVYFYQMYFMDSPRMKERVSLRDDTKELNLLEREKRAQEKSEREYQERMERQRRDEARLVAVRQARWERLEMLKQEQIERTKLAKLEQKRLLEEQRLMEENREPIDIPLNVALRKSGADWGYTPYIRIFKSEKRLELWMKPPVGEKYIWVKTYPILAMSGKLGPKTKEGDWQAPEGFYQTSFAHLNPKSNYHLSFNVCYPNPFDKALGRTGSFIMVHGGACSVGCFALGDPSIEELYEVVKSYLSQDKLAHTVPIHIYPFIPNAYWMREKEKSPHLNFWSFLYQTHQYFEDTHKLPTIRFVGEKMYFKEADKAYPAS